MNLKQAVKKYGRRFPIVTEYEDYDKYIYVNDGDPDLQKWRVAMPDPPDWDKISGFGLKPRDQFFQTEKFPSRLTLLIDNIKKSCQKKRLKKDSDFEVERKIYNETWTTLENKSHDYRDEIDWIKTQWSYRIHGKWYFINGKPYYINGWNWFYLNYFNLEGVGLPDFRYRDLKFFHAVRYSYTTTETIDYKVVKKDGEDVREIQFLDDGTLKMKNVGTRTSYGINALKGRRIGETSKAMCINYCIATDNIDANCGIQGNNENTAESIYNDKLLYAFNKMAFFFVPEMPNYYTNSGLHFSGLHGKGGLNSKISFATTAKKSFYDQKKLSFIHLDEVGKVRLEKVSDRHDVVKLCCSVGVKITGLLLNTSTSDELESEAGQEFERLSLSSMFEDRMPNGQTKSGVFNLWFNITESMDGFIDQYGFGIEDNPKDYQIPYMSIVENDEDGNVMGAKAYVAKMEREYADAGDLKSLSLYQRQHPASFRKCFSLAAMGSNFNTKVLQERVVELKFDKESRVRKGNFVWVGQPFESKVEFVDDINGPFNVSWMPPKGQESRTAYGDGERIPDFDLGVVISADPYRFSQTDSHRQSKGGIAAFRMFDERVDGDKDVRDYETENFVCTYCHREENIDAFSEAILRCAVFYNALVFGENNVGNVQDFFTRVGYRNYLMYSVDPETGVRKKNAGFSSASASIKPKLFTLMDTWINLHAHKTHHADILEDCLQIKDFQSTKDFDLFVAACGALLASKNRYADIVKRFSGVAKDGVDVKGWW